MSIENFNGFYEISCDECGEETTERFDDFYEAVEWKKENDEGWGSRKNAAGVWEDLCPECLERYKNPFGNMKIGG